MPEVGDVFQEVFFVEAKPPEANEIAAAQAEAVNIIHLEPISLQFLHILSTVFPQCAICHGQHTAQRIQQLNAVS